MRKGKRIYCSNEDMTLERLKAVLDYNPETGLFTWLTRPAFNSRRQVGDIAGTIKIINGEPRRYIGIDDRAFVASRLAWFYTYGVWPQFRLLMKDGNTDNLAISNLEESRGLMAKFDTKAPGGMSAYNRARRAEHPEHVRSQDLLKRFGINIDQYNEKLAAQNGVCAICLKPERMKRGDKIKNLAVDHHHESGRIRDLLCEFCNKMIGFALEDKDILKRAIAYLEKHVAVPEGESS